MLVCGYNGKIEESQAMFVKIRSARRERMQADRMIRKLKATIALAEAQVQPDTQLVVFSSQSTVALRAVVCGTLSIAPS